jgi:lipopolysaccharide transport system ATP-binding protein
LSDSVIKVAALSKQYRIGEKREKYKTLRDSLTESVLRSVRGLGRAVRRNGHRPNPDRFIWALRELSFEVKRGEVLGIIGRNGAGKSTLLKILSRITEPTSGYADVTGRVGSLLEVGTGFHAELTGRENIYLNGAILGMKRAEIEQKFEAMIDFAEIPKFIDTPVKHYSSGMYLRLAFAVAAHLEPEIMLVDEVLAVGDAEFQKKCRGKMRDVAHGGRTILFVSHNMEALLSLCSRCIVISDGGLTYDGAPEDAVNFYHKNFSSTVNQTDAHMVYNTPASSPDETCITQIEILDAVGNPQPILHTWDDLLFRIHYQSAEDIRNGSVILDIRDFKDQRLIVLDSGLRVPLRKGTHTIDCFLPRLPLPAGEFFLAGGLTVSSYDWLWRQSHLGALQVYGSDVLELGRPPSYSRMMFVAAHEWSESSEGGEPGQSDFTFQQLDTVVR